MGLKNLRRISSQSKNRRNRDAHSATTSRPSSITRMDQGRNKNSTTESFVNRSENEIVPRENGAQNGHFYPGARYESENCMPRRPKSRVGTVGHRFFKNQQACSPWWSDNFNKGIFFLAIFFIIPTFLTLPKSTDPDRRATSTGLTNSDSDASSSIATSSSHLTSISRAAAGTSKRLARKRKIKEGYHELDRQFEKHIFSNEVFEGFSTDTFTEEFDGS